MHQQRFNFLPAALAIAAALALSACNKQSDQTVGQSVDSTMAKVEQKTDQATAEVKKDVGVAKAKIEDAAITTSINAKLAADASLSALKINVDTTAGNVALKGTAPTAAAKDHATQLAQSVDGVVNVDNQLTVSN